MMTTMNRNFELKGRHVLAMLLGFFAVVVVANLVYVFVALDTFRGLSTTGAYRKGLDYNQTIAANRAQQAAGWQVDLTATPVNGGLVIEQTARDRAGDPVNGLEVTGSLRHPVDARNDRVLDFTETAPGHYLARVDTPLHGQWSAEIEARHGGDVVYRREQRLWLK